MSTNTAYKPVPEPSYISDSFPGSDPYAPLVSVPFLPLRSSDFSDGDRFSEYLRTHSPQLSWEPGPEGTQSYAITCFDPDAPTASGFWHWAVFNIPADTLSLDTNAGEEGNLSLPDSAVTLRGDSGVRGYYGPKPPAGHGPHRYLFAVHAVDTMLDIDDNSTPTVLGFNLNFHALARGILWMWEETEK